MRKILLKLTSRHIERIYGSVIGTIGFILSPASWWNDLVVNIPLALIMAKAAQIMLPMVRFDILFIVSYWITNIVGIVMMIYGYGKAVKPEMSRKSLIISLLIATIYTILAVFVIDLVVS